MYLLTMYNSDTAMYIFLSHFMDRHGLNNSNISFELQSKETKVHKQYYISHLYLIRRPSDACALDIVGKL